MNSKQTLVLLFVCLIGVSLLPALIECSIKCWAGQGKGTYCGSDFGVGVEGRPQGLYRCDCYGCEARMVDYCDGECVSPPGQNAHCV